MPPTTTLRPGLLVSLHTRVEGGVAYRRVDLDASAEKVAEDGASVEKWTTTKITDDPASFERAITCRNKAGSLIRAVCTQTAFGLLCLADREKELDTAIAEAQDLVARYNADMTGTRVSVYAIRGRIAESDAEAARGIAGQLRELLDQMAAGVTDADVEKIRKAATTAKKVGSMLDAATAKKVASAVDEVREVAKEIVKKTVAKGVDVGAYIREVQLKAVDEARRVFLELDEPAPIEALPVAVPAVEMEIATQVAEGDATQDEDESDVEEAREQAQADDSVKEMAAGAYAAPELDA